MNMLLPWQEIITFIIIGIALYLLLKRYVFRNKMVKGAGEEECAPCSTGSCDGCAVMDLKLDIEAARKKREKETVTSNDYPNEEPTKKPWERKLNHEILLRKKKLK